MTADHDAIHARRQSAAAPVSVSEAIRDRVTDTLTSAFSTDPVMNYFLRQDHLRADVQRAMIGMMVQQYMASGWAVAADDGSCATLWRRPDQSAGELGFWDQIRMLPRLARMCTLSRVPRVMEVMDAIDKNHPKEPAHYYLFMIGVHQDHQGQGLGSSILASTLEAVDADRMPAYLENSNPKNTPLYERHGFKALDPIQFGKGDGPVLLPMWREARA